MENKAAFKTKIKKFLDRSYLSWIIISLFTYLIIETVNQRGIIGLLKFIVLHPYSFIVNLAIVLLSYSVVLFVKRKLFCYTLVFILWTVMTVTNLVVLIMRNTQFNFSDVFIFKYGIFISPRYLKVFHYILIVLGIVIVVTATVILFKKGYLSRSKNSKKRSGIIVGALFGAIVVMTSVGNITGLLQPRYKTVPEGYASNGFVYAFICSITENGVAEPDNFSDGSVEAIISDFTKNTAGDIKPNIIFIQLESFIDPSEILGVSYKSDPVPNFTKLKKEYPSGYLNVSVLGGGTANTEFEVLTGMNIDHFGSTEVPYETFLSSETCETMAYNCKALGYKTHAIHNFSAGFYMRNKVFSNMGFDTFTSFEYMTDAEYSPTGWVKDKILERYIFKALDSTSERDFIQTITVQGHGSYSGDTDIADTMTMTDDMESYRDQLGYYVSQLSETDAFIGSLIKALEKYDEPTIVAFYGDHLPGISFSDEMLKTGTLYKTEYVIWANFEIDAPDRELDTYQLAAYVQTLSVMSSGQIAKLHQTYWGDENYEEYLRVLEYDLTKGNKVCYGGKNPFAPTDITMGLDKIKITGISYKDKTLTVKGENFNEHSTVYINGHKKTTEYIDKNTLKVKNLRLKDGDKVTVAQMSYQMPWSYLTMTEEIEY